MARKTAHPDSPAPDSARRPGRPAEPAEGDDAPARAAREAALDRDAGENTGLPLGLQKTRVVDAKDIEREEDEDTYSEDAIGGLDPDPVADQDNPQGMQTGRGALNQADQGNRQEAEADELENVEPDLDPYKSPR